MQIIEIIIFEKSSYLTIAILNDKNDENLLYD